MDLWKAEVHFSKQLFKHNSLWWYEMQGHALTRIKSHNTS